MKDFKKTNRFGGGHTGGTFIKRGFKAGPKRDFSSGPVEMHQATCAHCKKPCQVPFRPNGKKPVFCKDCFSAGKTDSVHTPYRAPVFEHGDSDVKTQIAALNSKIDQLVRMVEALERK